MNKWLREECLLEGKDAEDNVFKLSELLFFMKISSFFFFIIGILLLVSRWKRFIIIHPGWIALCFIIGFLLFYINIHNKNKEKRTPRPVYIVPSGKR